MTEAQSDDISAVASLAVLIASALWVRRDAENRMVPWFDAATWSLFTLLLWIPFFPLYLIARWLPFRSSE